MLPLIATRPVATPAQPPAVDPDQFPNFAEAIRTGAGLDFDSRFTTVLEILLAGFATD
jgi:hypothetical protein